jgi:ATP-dependent RNA helicase UAP56/SUB2
MTMADQELEEYEEEIEEQPAEATGNANKGFVGVHTVSFDDMQLKRELLRAITDCGFEHPSESALPGPTAPHLLHSESG